MVSIDDATVIQQYLANIIDDFDLTTYLCADFNNDYIVSIDDVTGIQKKLANK